MVTLRAVPIVRAAFAALLLAPSVVMAQSRSTTSAFTLEQIMSAPFATNIVAAPSGERLAWTLNERGLRNVWVAEGPRFTARRLTTYLSDDAQELNAVQISPDGNRVVYTRGGDYGANFDDALPVNPAGAPFPNKTEIWSAPFAGGAPVSLGEGENPVISPKGDVVVFTRAPALECADRWCETRRAAL